MRVLLLRCAFAAVGGAGLYMAWAISFGWIIALVGLAVIIGSIDRSRAPRSALIGLFAGYGYFVSLLDFTRISTGSVVAWIALATTQALSFALAGWGTSLCLRQVHARGVAGTVVWWLAIEELRSTVPFGGFPWGRIGHAFTHSPLARFAPFGSVELVGALALLTAIALAFMIRSRRWYIWMTTAVLAVGSGVLVPVGSQPTERIRVEYVQSGWDPPAHDTWERALNITKRLDESTTGAADLVVWPESASDIDFRAEPDAGDLVRAAAAKAGVPILLGTQEYLDNHQRTVDYVLVNPDGSVGGVYHKTHPVPFGEYIPERQFFSKISGLTSLVEWDAIPGDQPAVMKVPLKNTTVIVGVPICFEIAYTSTVREAVDAQAQFIVVPTNNASFGESTEAAQQFQISSFAAMEFDRTVIQVSTTGVSGVIEPNGVAHGRMEVGERGAKIATIGLRDHLTVAARIGGFLPPLVGIAAVLMMVGALVEAQWNRRSDRDHGSRRKKRR